MSDTSPTTGPAPEVRLHIAEYLMADLTSERWHCRDCDRDLGSVHDDYKRGLLIRERDPAEVHPAGLEGTYTFAPDGEWIRILEFICPGCGRQVETEYLPPGHPITRDTEIDIASIKSRLAAGEVEIDRNGKLVAIPGKGARPQEGAR